MLQRYEFVEIGFFVVIGLEISPKAGLKGQVKENCTMESIQKGCGIKPLRKSGYNKRRTQDAYIPLYGVFSYTILL